MKITKNQNFNVTKQPFFTSISSYTDGRKNKTLDLKEEETFLNDLLENIDNGKINLIEKEAFQQRFSYNQGEFIYKLKDLRDGEKPFLQIYQPRERHDVSFNDMSQNCKKLFENILKKLDELPLRKI